MRNINYMIDQIDNKPMNREFNCGFEVLEKAKQIHEEWSKHVNKILQLGLKDKDGLLIFNIIYLEEDELNFIKPLSKVHRDNKYMLVLDKDNYDHLVETSNLSWNQLTETQKQINIILAQPREDI